MIVTDITELKIPCEPCKDIGEGADICWQLKMEVAKHPNAIGLAANQISIFKRVFIIKSSIKKSGVEQWLNFINPVIVKHQNRVIVKSEGCLSFPDEEVTTERFADVWVKSMSFLNTEHFEGIQAICIQHELDHLDGITMFDREFKDK